MCHKKEKCNYVSASITQIPHTIPYHAIPTEFTIFCLSWVVNLSSKFSNYINFEHMVLNSTKLFALIPTPMYVFVCSVHRWFSPHSICFDSKNLRLFSDIIETIFGFFISLCSCSLNLLWANIQFKSNISNINYSNNLCISHMSWYNIWPNRHLQKPIYHSIFHLLLAKSMK